jgi:copper chaperone CopZ
MYGTVKTLVVTWLLCGAIALLAGCPAAKDKAGAAQSGVQPGERIAVTPQPDAQKPPAPPAAPTPQELSITTFAVTGMTGPESAATIEAKVIKLPGVTTVSADAKTGVVKVQFDPKQDSVGNITSAINSLGFSATETSTSTTKPPAPAVGETNAAPETKAPEASPKPAPEAGK